MGQRFLVTKNGIAFALHAMRVTTLEQFFKAKPMSSTGLTAMRTPSQALNTSAPVTASAAGSSRTA